MLAQNGYYGWASSLIPKVLEYTVIITTITIIAIHWW